MSLQAQNEKGLKAKERVARLDDADHFLTFLKVMSVIFLIALLYSWTKSGFFPEDKLLVRGLNIDVYCYSIFNTPDSSSLSLNISS